MKKIRLPAIGVHFGVGVFGQKRMGGGGLVKNKKEDPIKTTI